MESHVWRQVLVQQQLIRKIQHIFVNPVTAVAPNAQISTIALNVLEGYIYLVKFVTQFVQQPTTKIRVKFV